MVNTGLQATITALLTQSGLDAGDLRLTALDGGGNNRVYAVDTAGGRYLAKAYFSDAADTRDRLGAEYRFLRYAGKYACGSLAVRVVVVSRALRPDK